VVADALSRKSGMIAGIKVDEEIIRDLECLRIEPDVISRIKEAQKEDSEIWTIVEKLDKQVGFRLDDGNALWQDTRLVVPNDASLREALLTEAHSSPFSIHPGSTKMYHDLKQHFWWSGMKGDVAMLCLICQQVKIEHQRASGLLQPLDILVWKWDKISMDFVTGLPQTQRRHDAIWVVVDRLTKSVHFLLIRKDYSVSRLVETFQKEIVRLHGTPSAIVSDRDPRFASRFWKGNWDDYISLVEFAYNNSWHASIKCAPFEMLYGRKCRAPICWDQVGERVIEGLEMIEVTNEKVVVAKEKLKEARTRHKSYDDKHHRPLEFQPEGRYNTAEADTASKSVTFTLSHIDKPLSFDLDMFSSIIGLDRSDECVLIPPKETGLNIDIADILFLDLIAHLHPKGRKNQRKLNVCYTRYLSFIMKHLLQDNYKNDKLLSLKPFNITSITFKPKWKNETALTSHMCKVAGLSPEPIQPLIPPSDEVNADDTADKSLSGTSVSPVTQPKAPIAKRPRKKEIPSSTQPDVLKSSRNLKSSSTKATHLHPAKKFMVLVDATKVLDAFESAEERVVKLWATPDLLECLNQNIMEEEDDGVRSPEEPTFEQLMDEVDKQNKAAQEKSKSPYDTELEIKIVKSFKSWSSHLEIDQTNDANITFMGSGPINMELDDTGSDLHSIPSDDLASLTGFKTPDSADKESNSVTKKHLADNLNATSDGDIALLNASAVSETLKETFPGLLVDALKASLLSLIQESVKQTLEEHLDTMIYKPMNKQFQAFSNLESNRFVILQTKLSKVIKSHIGRQVKAKVRTGMRHVTRGLDSLQGSIQDNSDCVSDLIGAIKNMNFLLDIAEVFKKANAEGESGRKTIQRHQRILRYKKLILLRRSNLQRMMMFRGHLIAQEITENTLIVYQSEKENSKDITSGMKDSEDEPPIKKLKVLILTSTPLSSIIPEHPLNPSRQKLSVKQFIDQLFSKTSSIYTPSPLREPTPLRDPSKGKGGALSQEDLMVQLKEMKRLAELKDEKEKSLRKIMNLDATMRITKDHDLLNVMVYEKFRLKTLGFSEWLEVQSLASKTSSKSNDLLLQSLRAEFNGIISQVKKLGILPPPELAHFGKPAKDKKRKRTKILTEVLSNKT
nr:retrotransposon protein, putative, Ty3-gypsy subclass [Tanacetum cinerariifolium]